MSSTSTKKFPTFYKAVIFVSLPIMLQQAITQFVGVVDNLMIGQVGTEQMAGVAIANQLLFVYYILVWGTLSGAGIFAAQFFGAKNVTGVRYCFRFKWITGFAIFLVALLVLRNFSEPLIRLFLQRGVEEAGNPENVLGYAQEYLAIMLFGALPFVLNQVYASTLRETKETIPPMIFGIISIVINVVFNYLLIFGKLGFPALGVRGAAIATAGARFLEFGLLAIYTHVRAKKYTFIQKAYHSFHVPMDLTKKIARKGAPLLLNEALWAGGMTLLVAVYALRGLSVVASFNIAMTIGNLFFVVYLSLGHGAAIIIGQLLGASKLEEAKYASLRLLLFSSAVALSAGLLLIMASFYIPQLYNTTDTVRNLATSLMIVIAVSMPLYAFNVGTYFILRAGGVTFVTLIFDSGFIWVFSLPIAYLITVNTEWSIIWIYLLIQMLEIIKSGIGLFFIKRGIWIRNLVA